MALIYALLSYLVFGVGLPFWLILMPRLRAGLWQRLGLYAKEPRPWPVGNHPRLWFHGASAGDIRALRPVIRRVRSSLPDATIVVSAITDSGYNVASDELSAFVDGVVYAPLDLPATARRAIDVLRPNVLVIEAPEIWPHLLGAASASGARLVLVNGRLNPNRMGAYRWLSWASGAPIRRYDRLLMSSAGDADRVRLLGAPAERIEVTGSTKFDDLMEGLSRDVRLLGKGHWLVAGSTHEDDEAPILDAFGAIRAEDPRAQLLLVPRYPERARHLVALGQRKRWKATRSGLNEREAGSPYDVVVVDVMGRLRDCYPRARVAFVGGSFGRRGGHNILEPAMAGVPIVTGPDLRYASEAARLLRGRGLTQAADGPSLCKIMVDLWCNESLRQQLGHAAKAIVANATGASPRNAEIIAKLAAATRVERGPTPG